MPCSTAVLNVSVKFTILSFRVTELVQVDAEVIPRKNTSLIE
jgi:hypothetical protein